MICGNRARSFYSSLERFIVLIVVLSSCGICSVNADISMEPWDSHGLKVSLGDDVSDEFDPTSPLKLGVPVILVVSHCKKSLHWLSNLTESFKFNDVVIFSKCGVPVIGAPRNSHIEYFPNVGRCDHSYAYYISAELNMTKGVVLFIKDTTHVHNAVLGRRKGINIKRSYQVMLEAAAGPSQFSCRQYIDPRIGISNEAISKYLTTYRITEYNMSFHNYLDKNMPLVEPFAIHSTMQAWLDEVGVHLPQPLTPMCYGGVFAVNVRRLLAVDREVWANIVKSLSRADNILEGHFMERSWAGMLSAEPPAPHVLQSYLNDTALCFMRKVCGLQGHIMRGRDLAKVKRKQLCHGVRNAKVVSSIQWCPLRQLGRRSGQ